MEEKSKKMNLFPRLFLILGLAVLGSILAHQALLAIHETLGKGVKISTAAKSGVTPIAKKEEPLIPPGAVMFFNLLRCPKGWTELNAAQGRYIVGLPAGGYLAGIQGAPLLNLEDRPVGQHVHGLGQSNQPQWVSAAAGPGERCIRNYPQYLCTDQWKRIEAHPGDRANLVVEPSGPVVGTNAPYIQLLACQKL